MGKTLQRVGVMALILWTLAGFVAWGLASNRVHIVFEEGGAETEEQAKIALLNDRVSALSEDLRGLATAVSENFGALVAELEREKAASLVAVGVQPALRVVEPPTDVSPETLAKSDPEKPAEPARSKSFLSFKLPSDDFQFDEERTFKVLSGLSKVGFDGKSTIHDFTGVADKLEGSFTVNPAQPDSGASGELSIQAAGILTGSDGRDEEMYDHLAVEDFERIWFRLDSFEAGTVDRKEERLDGKIHGRMTIRGVERAMTMSVQGHMDESRRFVIEGEMALSQADFNVPVPAKLGMISMEDQVRVWVHILARPIPRPVLQEEKR